MSYLIREHSRERYDIEYDNQPIFSLNFTTLTNFNAEAELTDGRYQFTKESFWTNDYDITKEEMPFGKISFNYKGDMVIQLIHDAALSNNRNTDNKTAQDYYIPFILKKDKRKGFFAKIKYELFQSKDFRPLITIKRTGNWFENNFQVTLHHIDSIPIAEETIILIIAFGAIMIEIQSLSAGDSM